MLVGNMVLFYLFIEGQEVLDLDVGQGLNESLITSIVDTDILMYLSLTFFIHFRQKVAELAAMSSPYKIFDQGSLTRLLNGARGTV